MDTIHYYMFDYWEVEGDPLVKNYPLLRGGPWVAMSIVAFYAYFVKKLGPALMKDREPFVLKHLILAYNFFMMLANAFFFYQIMVPYRFGIEMNVFNFERLDRNTHSNRTEHILFLGYLYLLSKYLDLLETVFFVLRKKYNQISNLHVYHHSVVPILVHMFLKVSPGGGPGGMFPLLNTFIHIIMYLYYSLAVLGLKKYIWWKKYLTQLQLGQFIIFGIYGCYFIYRQKGYPPIFNYLAVIQPAVFFLMFYSFYRSSYVKRAQLAAKHKQQEQNNAQYDHHSHQSSNGIKTE